MTAQCKLSSPTITNHHYPPLSSWGDHYWMVDFDMDCSQTEDGWFEVKAFLTNAGNGWEGDISQVEAWEVVWLF